MKKIIKNLMLVAVAAMAFVACSQEGNEVNILAKKTTYEFVASFDAETRSQFVEDTDGDKVFQSVWNGGEEVLLFADAGNSIYADGTATMVLPEGGDGTTATFTGEFNGTVPPAGIIKAYVPAAAWNVWSEAITIPATQTPTDHSVDSAAHILFGQTDYTDNTAIDGSDIMFSHAVAYGKMTIADAFESIDEVTITIDETEKYTINTNELTSSTIWFACYANENVNNLEVLVKSGDKTYVRTYNLSDGKLAFKTGRVSIFSVSNFEEYVAPAAPAFTSATYNGNSSDKIIKLYSDVLGELWINFYGDYSLLTSDNWVNEGQYGIDNGLYFGGNYGQYKPVGYSDYLTATPTSFTLDVSIVDNMYKFVVNADYSNQVDGVTLVNAVYHGDIEGLDYYDDRTKLEAPVGNQPTVDGKTVTFTWSAVEGADRYYVYCYQDNTINTTTTELTATFTMPEYGTYYYFYIQAVADETNTKYRSSDAEYLPGFETGAEPVGDITFVSAVAAYNSNNPNWYNITFTDASNRTLSFTIGNGNVNYWNEGTWNSNNWYGSNALGLGSFNGGAHTVVNAVVSVVDGAYNVELTWDGGTGLFNGQIEGFVIPGTEGGDTNETTALTITRVVCTYAQSNEVEIHFTDTLDNEWGIDFHSSNPLVAGTYSLTDGTLVKNYTQHCGTGTDMTECTVVVTDNGDDTYNYDAEFTYNGKNYTFNVDSAVKGQ